MTIALAAFTLGLALQSGHHPDPAECNRCKEPLQKATEYVLENYKRSGLAGHVYAGYLFMMSGRKAELKNVVDWCCRAITTPGFNRNWYLGMCSLFLTEYSLKYGLQANVKEALEKGLEVAAEQQESTGGWGHHKGFREKVKKDYARDLGVVTCHLYASFLEMEKLGMDPGPIQERARKNLESIHDGNGFGYGTGEPYGADASCSRGGYVFLGLSATGRRSDPWYGKVIEGLGQRYQRCMQGHALGAIHYFGTAAAMHRVGPGEYRKFTAHYLDELISEQATDGTVHMGSDGKKKGLEQDLVASTAVFACIIRMQEPGVFAPKPKKKERKTGKRKKKNRDRGASPFGRRRNQ